jgi:hypothetical protein
MNGVIGRAPWLKKNIINLVTTNLSGAVVNALDFGSGGVIIGERYL